MVFASKICVKLMSRNIDLEQISHISQQLICDFWISGLADIPAH